MISTITTIKNRTAVLPKELGQSWDKAKVFVFSSDDTLIFKKTSKPITKLSDIASRVISPRMSEKEIDAEIQNYRQKRDSYY